MHKTVAIVHVLAESINIGLRINWVPNRICLIWDPRPSHINVNLVIKHQIYCISRVTELFNVEAEANARLFVVIGILGVSDVVPDLLPSVKFEYFILVIHTWRKSLLLSNYNLEL